LAQPGFYNDNAYRAYPFTNDGRVPLALNGVSTATPLPESSILDFGCRMNVGSGYIPGTHKVWLSEIRRSIDTLQFVFACDAPGCVDLPLTFERYNENREMATDYAESELLVAPPDGCDYAAPEPAWEGFLVTGDLTDLAAILTTHDDVLAGSATVAELEPAGVELIDGYRVRAVSIYNHDRTRVTVAEGCGSISDTPDLYLSQALGIAGDVRFREGFNADIRQNPNNNSLTFSAAEAGGLGRPCEEIPLYEGESYPGSPLLTGGPECKDLITTINGVSGPVIDLHVGAGITITLDPDNPHRIILDADLEDMTACFGRVDLYSSSSASSAESSSSSEIWHSYSSLSSDSACLSSVNQSSDSDSEYSLSSYSSLSSFEVDQTLDVEVLRPFGTFGSRGWDEDNPHGIDDNITTATGGLDGSSATPGDTPDIQEWNFEIPVNPGLFNRIDIYMRVRVRSLAPDNLPVLHGWKLRHTLDNIGWTPWDWLAFSATGNNFVWRQFTIYYADTDPLDVSDHRLQLWAPDIQPLSLELEALYITSSYDFGYQSRSESQSSSFSDSAGYLVDTIHPQTLLTTAWGGAEILGYLADGQIWTPDFTYDSAARTFDVRTARVDASTISMQRFGFYTNGPDWSGTAVKIRAWLLSRTDVASEVATLGLQLRFADGSELPQIPLELQHNSGRFGWDAVTWDGSWTAAELENVELVLDVIELSPLATVARIDTIYLEVHFAP
jgi:hypothetical protein